MEYINAIILAIGLCCDIFFASISQGLTIRKLTGKRLLSISALFALVQGCFAILAYQMSERIGWIFEGIDHYISFFLLSVIGSFYLIRSYRNEECDQKEGKICLWYLFFICLAISLDVLAITATNTFIQIKRWIGIIVISGETFLATVLGLLIGHKLGVKYRYKTEFSAGILLILLAAKLLLFGIFRK